MSSNNFLLQAKSINKFYKNGEEIVCVLNNVDLSLQYKEKIAIVGPSGSGKTTLLQILGLIETMNSGSLVFDNNDCNALLPNQINNLLRNKVSFIYQFHHLLPEFTVLENVIIPQLLSGITYDQASNKAASILQQMELTTKLNSLPGVLSGGQQQRVAIARAIVKQPLLILADEPTGNLDANTGELVFNILLKIVENLNIALVCVTHNPALAAKLDRCLTMSNGHLEI